MVRTDVRQDADIVRLVADATQDEPTASGLENGNIHVGAGQDRVCSARAGPVARVDHPLVDEDAVGSRRPYMPA